MRILRHLTPSGPAYAAVQSDGSAREISGDIYGDFRVTDRVVQPGKTLAPVVATNILCIGLNYKKHAAESNSPIRCCS
jgi:2-keto-4-pentenoate hydratase/2-oxohepta-3-ene-1,7-dioic acid hydratase in catechol pathway